MFLEALDSQTRSAVLVDGGGPASRLFDSASSPLDTATTTIPTIETNHMNPLLHHHHQDTNHNHNDINSNNIINNNLSNLHNGNNNYGVTTLQALPCFNDLIAVLIECFSLIAIGYFSGRFRVISPDAKDLGAYLTTFALPMIIFLNIAQMEIQTINLSFLVCMLISKLLIFLLVSLVTLAISYPSNFSYAGALSILSTQSNDFALGYPLFKSLYGESKPEMLNYLNLMGPIQLLIINPLGIVMLEFGKSQLKRQMRRRQLAAEAAATETTDGVSVSPHKGTRRKQDQPCAHCQARSRQADSEQQQQRHLASRSRDIPVIMGREERPASMMFSSSNPIDGDGGRPDELMGARRGARQDGGGLRRKNCESLVLVMPGRLVSSCSLSDDSIGSLVGLQQMASGKSISPNLVGDLSPSSAHQPGGNHGNYQQSPAPARRNWLAAFGLVNRQRIRSEPEIETSSPQLAQLQPPMATTTGTCTCHWSELSTEQAPEPHATSAQEEPIIDLGFLWALLTNPLIIVSLVALAVNLLHGPELPKFLTKVSNTIAASFAAPALIVVGLSMYGKFKLILRNPNDLLLASVLVMTKVMVLPNIMRTVMQVTLPYYVDSRDISYLVDFSYLYGLLPTAPGACIIAKQYEVLTNVVSISMLLSTFISAPLMLGTSVVISKAASITPGGILQIMGRVLKVSSSVTISLSLLTLYLLWKKKKVQSSLRSIGGTILRDTTGIVFKSTRHHLFTSLLTATQLAIGIGGFLWLFVDTTKLKPLHELLAGGDSSAAATLMGNDLMQPQPSGGTTAIWNRAAADIEDGETADYVDELHGGGGIVHQDDHFYSGSSRAQAFHLSSDQTTAFHSPSFSSIACKLSYFQASGGLLLAKFLILCHVVIDFARHSRGHQMALQISSLITRVFPLLAMGIIMCLLLESKHLTCQPTESSLPRWSFSVYLRLVFNMILLSVTLSLFVATFRLKNKATRLRFLNSGEPPPPEAASSNDDDDYDDSVLVTTSGAGGAAASTSQLTRRQFAVSNVSLSSGTSSELTTSTNLESNALGLGVAVSGPSQMAARSQPVVISHQQATSAAAVDRANLLIDYGRFYEQKLADVATTTAHSSRDESIDEIGVHHHNHQQHSDPIKTQFGQSALRDVNNNNNEQIGEPMVVVTGSAADDISVYHTTTTHPAVNLKATEREHSRERQHQLNRSRTRTSPGRETSSVSRNHEAPGSLRGARTAPGGSQFDRTSILVVYMIFQAMLSVTSLLQMLFQGPSTGGTTFIIVELTNLVVDIGQGLMTFLVVGT
uniref:Integral membrane protein GPR155 n=1 Tax=Aceria tosichella TaxID=561515 RepID=A0A6G1SGW2_9ACAR